MRLWGWLIGVRLGASHTLVQLSAGLLSSAVTVAGGPCLRRWLLAGGRSPLPQRSLQRLLVPSRAMAAGVTLRTQSRKERQSCTHHTHVPLDPQVGPAGPWEGESRHAAGRWDSLGPLEAGHYNADLDFITIEKLLPAPPTKQDSKLKSWKHALRCHSLHGQYHILH